MKEKIFNLIVYGSLTAGLVNGVYLALPVEYQAMIPEYSWLTALIAGGSTTLIGATGLMWKARGQQISERVSERMVLLGERYVEVTKQYEKLVEKVNEFKSEVTSLKTEIVEMKNTNLHLIKLIETDLKAKLSNRLIDEEVKAMIEGVLDEV